MSDVAVQECVLTSNALDPLLTVVDLERLLRIDRRTIDRLCKRGKLPKPLKVGAGNRWRARDIQGCM
jgi:predicted DNA-binding transcriptional regulator AlpA